MTESNSRNGERGWPLYGEYVLIVVLAVFMVSALSYGLSIVSQITNVHEPAAVVTQSIRYELTASHLWLEEGVGHDSSSAEAERNAYFHLNRAEAYLTAMRMGGTTPSGEILTPSTDPNMKKRLDRMADLMAQFRHLTGRHFPATEHSPSLAAETDHVYRALIRAAADAHQEAQAKMDAALATFRRDLMLMIAASILIGLGAIIYVRGFELRKARYRTKLEREIAERKDAQESLDRAQAIAHLGHWEWELDTGLFTCSDETRRILGVGENGLTSYPEYLAAVHPDDREILDEHIRTLDENTEQEQFDHRIIRPDHKTHYVRAQLAVTHTGRGQRVVGIIRDVTVGKVAEAAVADSEARYQHLFQSMAQGVVMYDASGNITSANPAAEAMLGTTLGKMTGRRPADPFMGAINEDGTPLTPDMHPMRVALREGRPVTDRVIGIYDKVSTHYRWLLASAVPQFQHGGQVPTQVHVSYTDITEKRRMEDEFRQARRMEALGTLVGGIAHDFNNILTSLQGILHLARRKLDDPEAVAARLTTAEQLGQRAADMVTQLLSFSRQRKVALSIIDFTQVVQDAVNAARGSVPEHILMQGAVPDKALEVHGDANLLQQVIMNLLLNARDALADNPNPVIGITLGVVPADAELRRLHPDLPAGHCALLAVTDNGCGIPQKHMDKLFEPFFTTKEVGQGTGLGLAMCYGTISAHGGAMEVDSRVGEGTTFRVYLPLANLRTAPVPTEERDAPRARRGETILVADDEELVRLTAVDVLADLGYTVLAAEDGEQAVQLFNDHPELHLALMDVVMPKLGGVEAVKRMRDIRPELPVIFTTGYDRDSVLTDVDDWQRMIVLTKPYPVARIGWKVRELIDGRE